MRKLAEWSHVLNIMLYIGVQFEQFVSYLKQRDRAGVVKLGSSERLWQRMLYILPWSAESCAMLEIPRQPSSCLLGLILPAPPSMST